MFSKDVCYQLQDYRNDPIFLPCIFLWKAKTCFSLFLACVLKLIFPLQFLEILTALDGFIWKLGTPKIEGYSPIFSVKWGFNPPKHRLIIKLPIVKSEVGIRRGIQHEQCQNSFWLIPMRGCKFSILFIWVVIPH